MQGLTGYELITLPTNQFFDTFRPIISQVVNTLVIIAPAIFLAFFCWGLLKSFTTGDSKSILNSLLQSMIILLVLLYMFPAFTLIYNSFNDLSLIIFPMPDLQRLNNIFDIFLDFNSDPSQNDFHLSMNGFVTAILYLVTKLMLFISRSMYILVFEYIRDILLFTSLFAIPFFLLFSLWESPRNSLVSIVKMMVEVLFWLPLLCFFLAMIFEYNPLIGKSNWIAATETHLMIQLESVDGPKYAGELLGKTFLFFCSVCATPMLGHMIFHGNAVSAASTIMGGGFMVLRSASRQISNAASSITRAMNPVRQAGALIKSSSRNSSNSTSGSGIHTRSYSSLSPTMPKTAFHNPRSQLKL